MMDIRSHGQIRRAWDRFYSTDMDGVFIHIRKADPMSVDVVPCFCCVEGELIGHDADHGPVFVVVDLVVEGDAAA